MEHVKHKAKDVKSKVQAYFHPPTAPPSPDRHAEADGSVSTSSLGSPATGIESSSALSTESPFLPSESLESVSRAVTLMRSAKSSFIGAIGDAVQSVQGNGVAQALGSLIDHLDAFSRLVDAISGIHPYAKMALSIFQGISTVITDQIQRDTALKNLLRTMSNVYGYVNRHKDIKELDERRETLLRSLSLQTVECAYFVRDQAKVKGFYKRAARTAFSGPSVDKQIAAYQDVFDSIRRCLGEHGVLETEIRVLKSLSKISDSIELLSFVHVRGAGHSSTKECLPGTRAEVLDDLTAWVNNPSSTRIRFLVGNAGRGKSAIAHSLAIRFDALKRLGCFFAFDRSFQGDRHPESVLPTIAHELSGWNADFKHSLANILREQPSLAHTTDIAAQWRELVLQPAKKITFVGQVLIVIDAFDESNPLQHSSRRLLLEQLTEGVDTLPNNFRILITARPEADVIAKLESSSSVVDSVDLDKYTAGVAEDMLKYIQRTIKVHELSKQELDGDRVKQLADKSEGLFQWAATACRAICANPAGMMLSERFDERLSGIIRGGPSSLDRLYSEILQQIFPSESEAAMTRFRSVMSQILCAAEPISSDTLQSLRLSAGIGQEDDVSLVRYMGALLSGVEGSTSPIRPLHTSFRDFLSDKTRSGRWYVNTQDGHWIMLLGSVSTLNNGVRFNICNIETSYRRNSDIPGLRNRITSPALVYAATYLKDHILISSSAGDPFTNTVLSALQNLFCKKLLLWLELMSILECVNIAPLVLRHVASLFSDASYDETRAVLQDAIRFIQQFAFPIAQSAPHVYLSALSFSPKLSIVCQAFISQFPYIPAVAGLPNIWPRLQYVLEDIHADLTATAWSRDGHHIVTGSYIGEICIWHASTGQRFQAFPRAHNERINSIQFSPDDHYIVSGSDDKTVRIWDAPAGEAVCDSVDNHVGRAVAVAYSPDGRFIASGSFDSTVRIRSADAGGTTRVLDRGCLEASIYSLAFSIDSQYLVVGASDRTVCIWDTTSCELVGEPLCGHSGGVRSICCSPDGRYMISGSDDQTLRIWDRENGTAVGEPLRGHSGAVLTVAYSPDGRRIISGSEDSTLRVWDADSGAAVRVALRGHVISQIAYSLDGRRVALLSAVGADVQIWEADMLEANDNTSNNLSDTHHSSPVNAVVYSPDGSRIASCSNDKKIRVYDASNGKLIGEPFVGHTDTPCSISYSPDGRRIVSIGFEGMVCVWNADTGECTIIANASSTGHSVQCAAYSPGGQHIVLGGGSGICVHNAETLEIIENILDSDSSDNSTWAIAYSPDGQRFVSGSQDGTLRVWDAHTRKPIVRSLKAHSMIIRAVAFSPDGHRIVSASSARSNGSDVRIWNADTLEPIGGPLHGHTGRVTSVAYSPDGRQLVTGSRDFSVRLWNAETDEAIGAPFYGHSGFVWSVVWSPNGQFIASGSEDSTIRIWKVEPEQTGGASSQNKIQAVDESTGRMANRQQPPLNFGYPGPSQEPPQQSSSDNGYSSQPRWLQEWRDADGWIVDGAGNLLTWVPREHRHLLSWSRTHMLIAGTDEEISIDFSGARHGTEWAMCVGDGGNPI